MGLSSSLCPCTALVRACARSLSKYREKEKERKEVCRSQPRVCSNPDGSWVWVRKTRPKHDRGLLRGHTEPEACAATEETWADSSCGGWGGAVLGLMDASTFARLFVKCSAFRGLAAAHSCPPAPPPAGFVLASMHTSTPGRWGEVWPLLAYRPPFLAPPCERKSHQQRSQETFSLRMRDSREDLPVCLEEAGELLCRPGLGEEPAGSSISQWS